MIRDNVILEQPGLQERMNRIGIFGTVILHGPLFEKLGKFFVEEFAKLPRIGGRDWGDDDNKGEKEDLGKEVKWRKKRLEMEKKGEVLWTACHVRQCTVVKVMAPAHEAAREWMGMMLKWEGTVEREIGEGGLMFVR